MERSRLRGLLAFDAFGRSRVSNGSSFLFWHSVLSFGRLLAPMAFLSLTVLQPLSTSRAFCRSRVQDESSHKTDSSTGVGRVYKASWWDNKNLLEVRDAV